MALKLMYITNSPEIAQIAEQSGVERIFVDLEIRGKCERQHNMDTVISRHTLSDISSVREKINTAELLVRINPIYDGSKEEINEVIERGADIIMLPMIESKNQVEELIDIVNERCKIMLLIETIASERMVGEISSLPGVDEIHIGLNDLHLQYKKKFMFQLLVDGTVEKICSSVKEVGKPYGIGGIAGLNDGSLPARYIIAEHYRMGSTGAILSRSFCDTRIVKSLDEISEKFKYGVSEIRAYEKELLRMPEKFFEENSKMMEQKVAGIVEKIQGKAEK